MSKEMLIALCGLEGWCVGKRIKSITPPEVIDYLKRQENGERLASEFRVEFLVSSPNS